MRDAGRTRFDFVGQAVVVTGGTKGIGRGAAEAFAEAGARVFVLGRDKTAGEAIASAIGARGGQAAFVGCDVTRAAEVAAAFARVDAEAGRLDVLVNSAGGFLAQRTVEETTEDEWDHVVDLNLKGVFLCVKAAIPFFRRQGSGRIVNLGSQAGVTTLQRSSPPYAAAKAGLHAFTRVLAAELGPHGVTANTLAPGTTATERVVALRSAAEREAIGRATPVGRIAEVDDMVGWVLFLASPEAGYLTGQTINVNGGRFMA